MNERNSKKNSRMDRNDFESPETGGKSRNSSPKKQTQKGKGRNKRMANGGNRSNNYRDPGRDGNHLSWYVADDNMLQAVANIPFSYRTGDTLPLAYLTKGASPTTATNASYVVPGIATCEFLPTYGVLTDPNSAGNVASTAVYSWVRHANSGSRNYDSVDLMQYLIAMDSVYMGISALTRLVSTALYYNRWTTYAPKQLVYAMGILDFDDLVANAANARARLNSLILKATTLAVPRTFSIFERHTYMASSVYMDEPNERAQYYMYIPAYLWQFSYDKTTSTGKLTTLPFMGYQPLGSWKNKFDIVENCLNALYGSEDAGIMSGDILKAYGYDNIFKFSTLPLDTTIVPLYDHQMLVQFHNGQAWGYPMKESPGDQMLTIEQNNSDVIKGPYLEMKGYWFNAKPANFAIPYYPLDLHNEITPGNVMEATRLQTIVAKNAGDQSLNLEYSAFGSEIVNSYNIYWKAVDETGELKDQRSSITGLYAQITSPGATTAGEFMAWASASTFTMFPLQYLNLTLSNTTANVPFVPFGNTDKLTAISEENIRSMHDIAMLGLFNIPRMSFGYTENS